MLFPEFLILQNCRTMFGRIHFPRAILSINYDDHHGINCFRRGGRFCEMSKSNFTRIVSKYLKDVLSMINCTNVKQISRKAPGEKSRCSERNVVLRDLRLRSSQGLLLLGSELHLGAYSNWNSICIFTLLF